jgi:hypothetical protein
MCMNSSSSGHILMTNPCEHSDICEFRKTLESSKGPSAAEDIILLFN